MRLMNQMADKPGWETKVCLCSVGFVLQQLSTRVDLE